MGYARYGVHRDASGDPDTGLCLLLLKRDELVQAAREARAQIQDTIYESPRKRRKPEWAASGMPDVPPAARDFVPANGLVAVAFEHSHGKMLMDGLRPKLHQLVGGASQASNEKIYTATGSLASPDWATAFGD